MLRAYTPNPRRPLPGRLALAGALTLLVLAGCGEDLVGGSEPVVLSYTRTVELAFTSEAAMMGQTTEIRGADRINLEDDMREDGFGKAEVLSASVESVTLEVQAPFDVNADFLNEATLRIEATGQSGATVATQDDFPATRDPVALDVRASEDIAGYVTAANFGVVLQIDPAALQNEQDYELELTIRFRVEFEGV